jgi:hypothetical protein
MPVRSLTTRLVVALVTSLSMFHLTMVGSAVVCSSGRAASPHGVMTMPDAGSHMGDDAAMASSGHEHSDAARQQSGHRTPAPERCCESMSSCGVVTVAGVVERASAPLLASTMPAHSDAMLASVGTAPEPPPPKA